jgi:HTH domain
MQNSLDKVDRPKNVEACRPEHLSVCHKELNFHCGWHHHLVHIPNRIASIVYQLALQLSHKSRVFNASAINIAQDLEVSRKTVDRAIEGLCKTGWFVPVKKGRRSGEYGPNSYRVLDHKEWARQHPGLCGEMIGAGDKLPQVLSQITGGTAMWKELQAAKFRSFGLAESDLVACFRRFWDDEGHKLKPQQVPAAFNRFLATSGPDVPEPQQRQAAAQNPAESPAQAPALPHEDELEAMLPELIRAAKGGFEFDQRSKATLRKHVNRMGPEMVKRACSKWLLENEPGERSRKEAALAFVEDIPRLNNVITQREMNAAKAKELSEAASAACIFTGTGGQFCPSHWTVLSQ